MGALVVVRGMLFEGVLGGGMVGVLVVFRWSDGVLSGSGRSHKEVGFMRLVQWVLEAGTWKAA